MSNQIGAVINAARMQWVQSRGFHPQSAMASILKVQWQDRFSICRKANLLN